MAISDDFYIDYQNKIIAHATTELTYDTLSGTFTVGETITSGGKSAIIVSDTGTVLSVVYVVGTFADNDALTGADSGATANVNVTITTKSTVYTSRNLYTFLQDTFDELGQLDDTVPMNAQTPTAFTLINGWFIDDESIKFLNGGAISTSGWDPNSNNDGIRVLTFTSGGYTSAVNTDIGMEVGYSGGTPTDTGTLLHFDNTLRKWWVRADDTGDTFANTATNIDLDDGAGTGGGTTLSAASDPTGARTQTTHPLYTNLFTLGTIELTPNPKTYIFQNSSAISEWWGRGDASAHIDVLIKVREAGENIDSGNVTVFVRHFGDLYDHFVSDLSSGGRQPVPLATQADINNNTTGEQTLTVGAVTNFDVNNMIVGGTSGASGEILAIDGSTMDIGNIVGAAAFTDTETITETVDGTASGGIVELDITGSVTGTVSKGDTMTGASSGATCTFWQAKDATTIEVYNHDGTTFTASEQLEVDGSNYYTLENPTGETTVTTTVTSSANAVAGYNDVGIWFKNVNVDFASSTGTVTEGDALTGATSGATCVFLQEFDSDTIELANWDSTNFTAGEKLQVDGSNYYTLHGTLNQTVTNVVQKAFEQGSNEPYSVVIDCATRTLAQVFEWLKYVTREDANSTQTNYQVMYKIVSGAVSEQDGEEYIAAQETFTPVKASPFGTFAGGKLFGATGVWIQNMANADIQNYQLTDNDGDKNDPPAFINITVSNLVSGDRVAVFRTSSGTTINRALFTSNENNAITDTTFEVNETIPSDVPSSGILRTVDTSDTSINRETRYFYAAVNRTGTNSFTSLTPTLDRTYSSGADTAYVPYMDLAADATSESVTVIYSTDRTVLARIRRYGGAGDSILPFESTGTLDSSGFSVVTIRTDDSIVE